MKASIWLRILAVLLVIFAVGHTIGTAAPKVTRGAPEAAGSHGRRKGISHFEGSTQ